MPRGRPSHVSDSANYEINSNGSDSRRGGSSYENGPQGSGGGYTSNAGYMNNSIASQQPIPNNQAFASPTANRSQSMQIPNSTDHHSQMTTPSLGPSNTQPRTVVHHYASNNPTSPRDPGGYRSHNVSSTASYGTNPNQNYPAFVDQHRNPFPTRPSSHTVAQSSPSQFPSSYAVPTSSYGYGQSTSPPSTASFPAATAYGVGAHQSVPLNGLGPHFASAIPALGSQESPNNVSNWPSSPSTYARPSNCGAPSSQRAPQSRSRPSIIYDLDSDEDKDGNKWICRFCDQKTDRKADMTRHLDTHYPEAKAKYPCEVEGCKRNLPNGFSRLDKLREHMRKVHHLETRRRGNY